MDMLKEFELWEYPPGTMFAYWFEGLMATCGWYGLNWETEELSRQYWDKWHYKKDLEYEAKQKERRN